MREAPRRSAPGATPLQERAFDSGRNRIAGSAENKEGIGA
jgi:hypothetical protein